MTRVMGRVEHLDTCLKQVSRCSTLPITHGSNQPRKEEVGRGTFSGDGTVLQNAFPVTFSFDLTRVRDKLIYRRVTQTLPIDLFCQGWVLFLQTTANEKRTFLLARPSHAIPTDFQESMFAPTSVHSNERECARTVALEGDPLQVEFYCVESGLGCSLRQ